MVPFWKEICIMDICHCLRSVGEAGKTGIHIFISPGQVYKPGCPCSGRTNLSLHHGCKVFIVLMQFCSGTHAQLNNIFKPQTFFQSSFIYFSCSVKIQKKKIKYTETQHQLTHYCWNFTEELHHVPELPRFYCLNCNIL